MQILYAHSSGGNEDRASVFEQLDQIPALDDNDIIFLENIIDGVITHEDELDLIIAAHSTTRKINMISKVELTILRIGAHEFLREPTIPVGATISEAVLLAKRYGDVKSYAFVNGVLASMSKSIKK